MTTAIEINSPHMAIYYDAELHDHDGNGWCVEFSEGSVTYRFDTLSGACGWIAADPFCEKFMKVRMS
mgnify:CR=1 FL=1